MPTLWAFEQLVVSFLPGHQRPQWLPGGVVLAQMRTMVWASLALDIPPILASVFDSISKHDFFIPHRLHSLSDFPLSTTF